MPDYESDLVSRIRSRPNDAAMPTEHLLDEAADALEDQATELEALKGAIANFIKGDQRAASEPPTAPPAPADPPLVMAMAKAFWTIYQAKFTGGHTPAAGEWERRIATSRLTPESGNRLRTPQSKAPGQLSRW